MSRRQYRGGKKTVMKTATEKEVHRSLCNYIRMTHPDAIFLSESSGLKCSIGTAVQLKALRSSHSLPDLWIMKPLGGYGGLVIEIKRDMNEVFTKDGLIRKNEHIMSQAKMLDRLHHLGYNAVFGCGLEHCIAIVDEYMAGKEFLVD